MITDLTTFKDFFKSLIADNPSWGILSVEFFDWFRVVNDQKVFDDLKYPALIIEEPEEEIDIDTEVSMWTTTVLIVAPVGNIVFDDIDILKNTCRNAMKKMILNLRYNQLPDIILTRSPTLGYKSHLTGDNLVGVYCELKFTTPKTC